MGTTDDEIRKFSVTECTSATKNPVTISGGHLFRNSGGCPGPTIRSGAFTRRPLPQRESADSVRIRSATRTAPCWTAWERLLPSSRN